MEGEGGEIGMEGGVFIVPGEDRCEGLFRRELFDE